MNPILAKLLANKLHAPEGDGEGGGGGAAPAPEPTVDRGDDVPPSPLDNAGKATDKLGPDDEKAPAKSEDVEGDETSEEKAEREKAEAEAEAKKRMRIPKSRFDDAMAKARAREQTLLEEIARMKASSSATDTAKAVTDMEAKAVALEDKYEDLLLDGKKDEARAVRKELKALRESLSDFRVNTRTEAARKAAIDEMTFNAALAGFEAQYPVLNPSHDAFDNEVVEEVADLIDSMVRSGKGRADALKRAVKYVLGSPPPAQKGGTEDDAARKRAADARKKAADADKRQPPDSKGVGIDSDKAGKGGGLDISRMSQKEFAALDEKSLARARGDEL